MTCERCVNAISKSIADLDGIRNVDISLERGTVTLETSLPYSIVQERIERTGRQAVLKGYGGLNEFCYGIVYLFMYYNDLACLNSRLLKTHIFVTVGKKKKRSVI